MSASTGESPTPSIDRRIRVLWLIKGLGPGGAEHLLVSHARIGDHRRFRYSVTYAIPWKNQLVPRLAHARVAASCIGTGRRGGLLWPLRVAGLVRSGEYDVVHAHSPLLAVAARLSARTIPTSRRPVIVSTEHNVWQRYAAPTRWLNAVTCTHDDHRWAVSHRVAESTGGRAADRTSVLIHGVVQDDLQPNPDARERVRAELGIPESATVVVTVANLREQKDYPNLMTAARAALDADDDVVFLAVGQGPDEAEIRSLHASLRLGERFRLLGYRSDVPDLLAAADLFVLASKYEGYPIAVMEALSMGLPVVSTDVGGVPDTVEEDVQGLLVPPHDPERLAAALLELIRDPARRERMSKEALTAGQRFDIRTAVAEQETLYATLASRSAPG